MIFLGDSNCTILPSLDEPGGCGNQPAVNPAQGTNGGNGSPSSPPDQGAGGGGGAAGDAWLAADGAAGNVRLVMVVQQGMLGL